MEYTTTQHYKYHTDNDWQVRIYPLSQGYNVVLVRQSLDGKFNDQNLCNPQHCDTLEGAHEVAGIWMQK